MIALEQFEMYLNDVKDWSLQELIDVRWAAYDTKTIRDLGDWEENFSKVLFMHLSKYHSDMRWQVKVFKPEKDDPYKHSKRNFKGAKMFFYNIQEYTVVVYGVNAHQKFYGKYDNEEYHEFDHVKELG